MASRTISRRCEAEAFGWVRCQGRPAGTQHTRSRPSISAASCARRKCPKCTGSKVPPMMPTGAAVRAPRGIRGFGELALRRPGGFFRPASSADLAAAEHDVLLRGETFQADGAARVQLVGRDADLGAQAVL